MIETNNTNTFFCNRHFCTSNFYSMNVEFSKEKKKKKRTNEIQTLFFILLLFLFSTPNRPYTCLSAKLSRMGILSSVDNYKCLPCSSQGKRGVTNYCKVGCNAWYFLRILALVVLLCFENTAILIIIIIMSIINMKTHVSAQDDFQIFICPPNLISSSTREIQFTPGVQNMSSLVV